MKLPLEIIESILAYCSLEQVVVFSTFVNIKPTIALNIYCSSYNSFHDAIENGYIETIKWLHNNKFACCNQYILLKALNLNHLNIVDWLIENCVDCSYRYYIELLYAPNKDKETALMIYRADHERDLQSSFYEACELNELTIVQKLYTRLYNLDQREELDGFWHIIIVAIYAAARERNLEIIKFLYSSLNNNLKRVVVSCAHRDDKDELLRFLNPVLY